MYRLWSPIELCHVEVPTFSRQSAHKWPCIYQPYCLPPERFLVLISVKGPRTTLRLEGLGQLKKIQ
jgi:hypothetical protein